MARTGVFLALLLCCWIAGVVEGETCYWRDSISGFTKQKYCVGNCCGSRYNYKCCSSHSSVTYSSSPLNRVAIIGIVVGCLFLVAIIVSIVICIVCCMRKSRGSPGQVVGQGTTVITAGSPYPTAVYNNQAYSTGQPAYIQGQPGFTQGPPEYHQMQNIPSNTASKPPAYQPQNEQGKK